MLLLNYLFLSAVQLALFCAIPLVVHLISRRSLKGFPAYVGLKPARISRWGRVITGFLLSYAMLFAGVLIYGGGASATINGPIRPAEAAIALLLHSFIRTGLSEEILFRGFLAKVLIGKLGYLPGNAMQAAIFGAIHFFFLEGTAVPMKLLHALLAAMAGFLYCHVNEKEADGSILPSFLFHGVSNALSSAFILLAG